MLQKSRSIENLLADQIMDSNIVAVGPLAIGNRKILNEMEQRVLS